jgi:hypothetical protein
LEDEFPKELEKSEQEADEIDALLEEMARAENNGEGSNPPGPSPPSGPLPPSGPSEGGSNSHSSKM